MNRNFRNNNNNAKKVELGAKEKPCFYCINGVNEVDYKEVNILHRFISSFGKIAPKRRSGLCSKHQRKSSQAIKRARIMALLPFLQR